MAVGVMDADSGKRDNDDALFFVAFLRDANDFLRMERFAGFDFDGVGFLPCTKFLFDGCLGGLGINVAENGDDAVVRDDQLFVKTAKMLASDSADTGFGARDIQAVTARAEKFSAHRLARTLEHVIALGADGGELNFFFALERAFGNGGVENDVSDQVETLFEIGTQDFGVDAEAVVAAVAVETAAERFDFVGDLFGIAGRCAFENALGQEQREAVVLLVFSKNAAFEHSAKFDEGETMILFEEKTEAVREFNLLNRFVDDALAGF